jgi:hypothetical protein
MIGVPNALAVRARRKGRTIKPAQKVHGHALGAVVELASPALPQRLDIMH